MSNRVLYPLLLVIVFAGAVAGYGFAGLDDQKHIDVAVTDALAAVTPAPTPEPTPIPTPLIQAPSECVDAIDALVTQSIADNQFILDAYGAYLDHQGENLTDFGRRVEALLQALAAPPTSSEMDELKRKVDVCRAAL